jgi:cysteine-rich repeat protein
MILGDEECEDDDTVDEDGCSSTCKIEEDWFCDHEEPVTLCIKVETNKCGNGIINTGETCDDFNEIEGDGCSNEC